MGCGRALLCILLPPLAVLDKGIGTILVILALTIVGWVPGVIGALVVCSQSKAGEEHDV
ncbi:MAG: YqaE/Pmp3 family membrane protein [Pseudomonadota bacterium]